MDLLFNILPTNYVTSVKSILYTMGSWGRSGGVENIFSHIIT